MFLLSSCWLFIRLRPSVRCSPCAPSPDLSSTLYHFPWALNGMLYIITVMSDIHGGGRLGWWGFRGIIGNRGRMGTWPWMKLYLGPGPTTASVVIYLYIMFLCPSVIAEQNHQTSTAIQRVFSCPFPPPFLSASFFVWGWGKGLCLFHLWCMYCTYVRHIPVGLWLCQQLYISYSYVVYVYGNIDLLQLFSGMSL